MMSDKKFIDTIELDDWEVLSPGGYVDVQAIGKTVEYDEYKITAMVPSTGDIFQMECADDHLISCMWKVSNFTAMSCLKAKDIEPHKHFIEVGHGAKWASVLEVQKTGRTINMFDLQVNSDDHLYYTNNIVSHNSIWLGDISAGISLAGYNVFVASLEMKAEKIIKRIGSSRMKISMDDYPGTSTAEIQSRMQQYLGGIKHGRLDVKQFAGATMTDIAIYVHLYEERIGEKYDVVVVDYLNELDSDDGISMENMYSYHKANVKHMVRVGIENDWAMVSAMQLKVSAYNLDDISLSDGGESSGVGHRIDFAFGIIQTETMHDERIYKLKALKTRDSGYKNTAGIWTIDYSTMQLNDMQEIVGDFGLM